MRKFCNASLMAAVLVCPAVWAESVKSWGLASDVLASGLPLFAGAMTLANQDVEGGRQLLMSTGSALLAAQILKSTLPSTRPDGSDDKSFPSAHTAIAFSAATYFKRRYGESSPAEAAAAYGLAALTGVARVQARKHRWGDVLAGASLGYASAVYFSEPVQGGRVTVLPATNGLAVAWMRVF